MPSKNEIDVLKRPHQKSGWSERNLIDLVLCMDDPLYFIENFVQIQHPMKGAVPFIPYEYQKRMIKGFHEHRFLVALTSRQHGKCSTYNTSINVDGLPKKIGKLVGVSFKEKIVSSIENSIISQQKCFKNKSPIVPVLKGILWLLDKDHRVSEHITENNDKKFTHTVNENFQSDFGKGSKIFRTVPYDVWQLNTTTKELTAADKHFVIKEDRSEVWIQDLSPGDRIITDVGIEEVVECRSLNCRSHMYDIEVNTDDRSDQNNHLYYTNGILSHNTTCAAAYLLWKAMFCPDTTILLTANKFVQALEIMDRIRYAYENLEDHIRAGVKEYNKSTISFDNGSKIVARATTADAGRGLSITLLYSDEFAFVPSNIQRDFWSAIQPVLSCVAGDTLVLTDGGYKRIEDFHINRNVGDYFELSGKVFGKNGLEDLSHGYVSPESDTFIIETVRGFKIECTKRHPLYVLSKQLLGEMLPAQNLKVGDLLRIQYNMNVYGNDHSLSHTIIKEITPELGYLIGGWIAEGWINRDNTIEISNTTCDFRDYYLNNEIIKPFKECSWNATRLQCSSTEMVKLFKEMGIDTKWKCDTKHVPDRIFRCSKEIQSSFLRGLFDGDGSMSSPDVINLSSTSRNLLNEVQLLLANMGIISTVRLSSKSEILMKRNNILPSGKHIKSARNCYSLTIARSNFEKFEQNIGFGIQYKKDNLRRYIEEFGAAQNDDKIASIPKTAEMVDFIKRLIVKSNKNSQWFRKNCCRLEKILKNATKKSVITYKWLLHFRALMKELNVLTANDEIIFNELVDSTYLWDSIKSITPSHNKTYDFTVPGTHSFLQNGILGSNTGGGCIITSTPKNDEDQFAQIWKGANDNTDEFGNPLSDNGEGRNGFFPFKSPWWEHPDRDDEWARPFRESLGVAKFAQEFSCCGYNTSIDLENVYNEKIQMPIGDLYNLLKEK